MRNIKIKEIVILTLLITLSLHMYCGSQCESNSSCYITPYDPRSCGVCANSLYAGGICASPIYPIMFYHTPGNMTMANGYYGTKRNNYTCKINYILDPVTNASVNVTYDFLGTFVSTDYFYKNYSILNSHYAVIIRYSMAFIGVWSTKDYLKLQIDDSLQKTIYNYTAICATYTEHICNLSRPGNNVDCIVVKQFTISHNTTSLFLNFSSLTSEKDPLIQAWSLFDIIIAVKVCDSACFSCFGSSFSQCIVCMPNFYLTGNTCNFQACTNPTDYILTTNNINVGGICVSTCPQGYYGDNITFPYVCYLCQTGCIVCLNATYCIKTMDDFNNSYSLFYDKMAIWIILIIIGALVIIALFWRFYITKFKQLKGKRMIQETNNTNNEFQDKQTINQRSSEKHNNAENFHIEEIDFHDHIKEDIKPRMRKRQEKNFKQGSYN